MPAEISKMTIKETQKAISNGEISAVEITNHYLKKIEAENSKLNAYLEVYDDCLDQAKKIDELKEKPGLAGVALAVKDNILIDGKITSAASKILENYRATYDATVIEKLRTAGAVFLGRVNMDEFAMGGSTENSAFGPTKNPHDLERVPGGTSGGSAAAVGADLCTASLGSDTGGSIRQPASFCGVVGLKPTYGTVSRFGLMAMSSSLDQIGPVAKTVEDAQILYENMAGYDELDSTSVKAVKAEEGPEKFIIGVPKGISDHEGLDAEVKENFEQSLKKLESLGHEVREVELPNLKYALSTYYIIMPAEVSSNMARYDGVRFGRRVEGDSVMEDYMKTRGEGLGNEVRRRILLGTYVLSAGYYDAYYAKATQVRSIIRADYKKAYDKSNGGVDVIVTPTAPTPAFKIGEKINDPLQMYLEDIFTVPANIAGIPAISVPSGKTKAGLPLGLQFLAPHFHENHLFKIGTQFEGQTRV